MCCVFLTGLCWKGSEGEKLFAFRETTQSIGFHLRKRGSYLIVLICVGLGVEDGDLYTQLWKLCAGPLVDVPREGERVFYFPQGHMEQVCFSFG